MSAARETGNLRVYGNGTEGRVVVVFDTGTELTLFAWSGIAQPENLVMFRAVAEPDAMDCAGTFTGVEFTIEAGSG